MNFIFENFITFTSRLPYSRRLEEEADEVGLMLAAKVNEKYFEKFFLNSIYFRLVMTFVNLLIFGKQLIYMKITQKSQNFYLHIRQMLNVLKILMKIVPWALDIRSQCNCSPLPQNKPLGALNLSKNPEEKVLDFVTYLKIILYLYRLWNHLISD